MNMPSSSGIIAIIGPMDIEVQGLIAKLSPHSVVNDGPFVLHRGVLCGKEVVVAATGVGKVLSSCCTQKIIDRFAPEALLCTGVAGALSPELDVGDLVIGFDVMQHDMDARPIGFERGQIPYTDLRDIKADERLVGIAREFKPEGHSVHVGRILSGDQFVDHNHVSEGEHLRSELGGMAIEMEGGAIGLICHLHKIPFLVVRTISDRADGSAAVDYNTLLPMVAKNSSDFVEFILLRL